MNIAAIGARVLGLLGVPTDAARRLAPLGIAIALLAASVAAWGAFQLWDWWDDRQAVKHAVDRANVKTLDRARRADDAMAGQAAADDAVLDRQVQEAYDAISHAEGGRPSAAAVAHNCQRLRAAGFGAPDLPEPCRSGEPAGSQAAPHR